MDPRARAHESGPEVAQAAVVGGRGQAFGGAAIFGTAVSMNTVDNPRRQQLNAFPGISGRESLDQGFDGRFTIMMPHPERARWRLIASPSPVAIQGGWGYFKSRIGRDAQTNKPGKKS